MITYNSVVPSRILGVEEHCTVVIWKQPQEVIINYQLIFYREEQKNTVLTKDSHPYYVIQPDDIPYGDGPVTVEVWIIIVYMNVYLEQN